MNRARRRGTSLVPDQLLVKTKHSRVHERPERFFFLRAASPGRSNPDTDGFAVVLSGGRCPREPVSCTGDQLDTGRASSFPIRTESRVYTERSDVPTTTNNAAPHAREPMRREKERETDTENVSRRNKETPLSPRIFAVPIPFHDVPRIPTTLPVDSRLAYARSVRPGQSDETDTRFREELLHRARRPR